VYFLASKAVWSLALPAAWAVVLLAAAFSIRRRAVALTAALLAFGAPLLLAFPPVVRELERAVVASAPSTARPGIVYDAAIVLAGNRYRIEAGAGVVRRGEARFLLYSGGLDDAGVARLRSRLAALGVPGDRLVIEAQSRNTHENAVESARVVAARRWSSLLLVTGAAHAERALGCFHRLGLRPDMLPVDEPVGLGATRPSVVALEHATELLHEVAGRWAYRLLGYSDP
jgi:uncharacterized SAM-binding protein YcdF (DUF218 family)